MKYIKHVVLTFKACIKHFLCARSLNSRSQLICDDSIPKTRSLLCWIDCWRPVPSILPTLILNDLKEAWAFKLELRTVLCCCPYPLTSRGRNNDLHLPDAMLFLSLFLPKCLQSKLKLHHHGLYSRDNNWHTVENQSCMTRMLHKY